PSPSSPEPLLPQHSTPPPLVSAQVWPPPASSAATPLAAPETARGVGRSVVVPSAGWPSALPPQHLTPPALVSAQVWKSPAEIAATPLGSPETATGAWRWIVVPSPSWPEPLSPQHLTPPALVSAQVWPPPAEIAATPLASPEAATGAWRWIVVPSPSWPTPLPPQHLTPPPLVSAQVCSSPAAIAAAFRRAEGTSGGAEEPALRGEVSAAPEPASSAAAPRPASAKRRTRKRAARAALTLTRISVPLVRSLPIGAGRRCRLPSPRRGEIQAGSSRAPSARQARRPAPAASRSRAAPARAGRGAGRGRRAPWPARR